MVERAQPTEVSFRMYVPNTDECLPLPARVERELIHSNIKLCAEVIQAAIVPKGSPLHVDAHPSLLSIHQLHIAHLFHVAGIASGACQSEDTGSPSAPVFHPPEAMHPHSGRRISVLTNDEANFTVRVFVAAGHHGPNCVIHDSNHVQVKLLMAEADVCLVHKFQYLLLRHFKTHAHAHTHARSHLSAHTSLLSPHSTSLFLKASQQHLPLDHGLLFIE